MIKLIKTLLAAGASLLAMTAAASADPVSIGSFILVNLLPGLIGTGIGTGLVGSIALGLGAIGLNIGLSLAMRQKIQPQEYKNTFSTGESSEIRAVGRVRLGGLKVFGNTKNLNRYRLIAHCKGPFDAIEAHYLGGREVTVEPDGKVSSPPWSWVNPNGGGPLIPSSESNVIIQSKVGDGTETAWSELTTDFPALWTSAHRVRGIGQTLVEYISPGIGSDRFLKLFQNVPDLELVLRADPVYDPRDVAQDVDDPSTWVWSDNGILGAVHVLRSYPNFTSADFDWDGIAAEADKADVLVDTVGGTRKRCRISGVWPSENARNEVMKQVLASIGAEIVSGTDDKILVRLIEDNPAPEIEFAARHIVSMDYAFGPEGVERPNLCVVKYYSPERKFEMAEIDLTGIAWARVQDEIDAYGEKPFTLELPFCPDAGQAQIIARRMFAMARADTGVAVTNQVGIAAWGLTYGSFEMALTEPDPEGTATNSNITCWLDTPRDNPDEPTIEIPFVVWPTLLEWDVETDEAPAPEEIPDLTQPSDLVTPSAPTEAIVVQYPDGSREMRVRYDVSGTPTYVEAVYRTYSGDLKSPSNSMTEVTQATPFDFAWVSIAHNILTNTDFSSGWTYTVGQWSVAAPYATKIAGVQSGITQAKTLPVGTQWDMGALIENRTAGSLRPRLGGSPAVEGTDISVNGAFVQTLTTAAASVTVNFRGDASFNGRISEPFFRRSGLPVVELGTKVDFRVRIGNADGDLSDFSPLLVVNSLAIDNTAPSSPGVAVGLWIFNPGPSEEYRIRLTITVPNLNVVKATVEVTTDAGSSWSAFDTYNAMRPGANVFDTSVTNAPGNGFRVTLYTSNGTTGPTGQAIVV